MFLVKILLVIIAASAIVTGIPAGAPLKTPRSFNPIASDLETGAEETGDLKGSASYGYGYYGGLSNYGYGLGYGYGGYSPYSYGSYPYGYGYYSSYPYYRGYGSFYGGYY